MKLKYVVASDNGNSTIKEIINGEFNTYKEIQPSLIRPILTLPTFAETDENKSVADLFDNLIVNVTSPSIKLNGLYAVGKKAQKMGGARNMNIFVGKKHKDDIPLIASFAMIAAKGVQEYYQQKNELPDVLDVEIEYSSALPALEFTPETARFLQNRFLKEQHIVQIYATKDPVLVNLKFIAAKVTQEGNPAVFAVVSGDEELLVDYNKLYEPKSNEEFAHEKIITIDIGDGTTELIYTINGKPIVEYCRGLKNGVGHAAEEASLHMQQTLNLQLDLTRQDFMKAVLDKNNHLHSEAKMSMIHATQVKAFDLLTEVQNMYQNIVKGDATLFLVIGGGSSTFHDALHDELKEYADDNDVKMLWIPAPRAATINVEGLDFLNKKIFFPKEVKVK